LDGRGVITWVTFVALVGAVPVLSYAAGFLVTVRSGNPTTGYLVSALIMATVIAKLARRANMSPHWAFAAFFPLTALYPLALIAWRLTAGSTTTRR
jgi:biotin transporter BioY